MVEIDAIERVSISPLFFLLFSAHRLTQKIGGMEQIAIATTTN